MLINAQKQLLESFIKLIASADDSKSPYTGGHCERVPILTLMLAQAACDAQRGTLLRIAWMKPNGTSFGSQQLHDCGKIVTPVRHGQGDELETIYDRIELVKARYEILFRDEELVTFEGSRRVITQSRQKPITTAPSNSSRRISNF